MSIFKIAHIVRYYVQVRLTRESRAINLFTRLINPDDVEVVLIQVLVPDCTFSNERLASMTLLSCLCRFLKVLVSSSIQTQKAFPCNKISTSTVV